MKIAEASLFVMYELTPEEQISGCILSTEQLAVIQNDIGLAAHAQASLRYDPLNPVKFAQEQASLAGAIAALRVIIDRSIAKQEELKDLAMQQHAEASYQEVEAVNNVSTIISEIFPKGN
jgi:hypothetical protein